MPEKEFLNRQKDAVERMWEMNSRSKFKTGENPPKNPQTAIPEPKKQNENGRKRYNDYDIFSPLQSLFSGGILSDSDTVILIGLLLILMSENTDKTLLFALVYILL